MSDRVDAVVESACLLGEGVIWSPRRESVLWTDIFGKALWSFAPATGAARKIELPDRLACFAELDGDAILAGFAGGLERHDLATGARVALAAIEPELPTTRLNDGKLDRRGRLIFGTMDEAPGQAKPIGQVWSYDGATPPRVLFGGSRISNSIAFSPDGRTMYFADTPTKTILAFDYDLDDGHLSNQRVFVSLGAESGYPDGSTVDADGCLWNAEWGGARVTRYRPDGRVDRSIAMPCSAVTCCAFGGADLATLYVTSARSHLDAAALAAQPLAGALFAISVGARGLPDTPFAGPR